MMALLNKIPQEEKDKGIVICGDLVDRGLRSMQVVQWCIDNRIPVVRGNHEQMMIDNTDKEGITLRTYADWTQNGGWRTFSSYFGEYGELRDGQTEKLFLEHVEWMKQLPYYLEFKDVKNDKNEYLLITHSSAAAVWKWSDERRKQFSGQFNDFLMWSRPNLIRPIPGIYNVFGHTPRKDGPRIKSCYSNIDTGCCYLDQGYGVLTALQYPDMIVYSQENIDEHSEAHDE